MDNFHEMISISPKVMMGKPCVKGTRITVELVLRELSLGASFQELLHAYPTLTASGIRAACAYGAAVVADEQVLVAAE
jgi:uncharacterized protein (DUF433 family)